MTVKQAAKQTLRSVIKKWRWLKWKLFVIWLALIAISVIFVLLPLLWPSGVTP